MCHTDEINIVIRKNIEGLFKMGTKSHLTFGIKLNLIINYPLSLL